MSEKTYKIGIIGAGAWGTTLANLLAEKNDDVVLWTHETEVVKTINKDKENKKYLSSVALNESLKAADEPSDLRGSDVYLIAVPTQFIRNVIEKNDFGFGDKPLVNVSKGIENETHMRVSQILADVSKISENQYAVLTGPSHAEEVVKRTPTTVVVASKNSEIAKLIQQVFKRQYFRVYTSDDVLGCELGGALKNVIAIAAGIIDGLELGDNTKAALITRGLAGMTRLGTKLGADPLTFSGLSGLGDLIVTCDSRHSRNRRVGEEIGKGKTLDKVLSEMQAVAEGVKTTISAYNISKKYDIDLPIVAQVYEILFHNVKPGKAIKKLMTRESKDEWYL